MLQVSTNPFPTLHTDRLVLRQMTIDDADDLFRLRSDPHVMQHIDRPLATSVQDARDLINRVADIMSAGESVNWVITIKGNNVLIGTIVLWNIVKEDFRAEVGYLLDPKEQGKGIMQETLQAVLDYGFEVMKLHKIEAHVNPANRPSIKLLEKFHFRQEAAFKDQYFFNGKFIDSNVYSILQNEFINKDSMSKK